MKKQRVISWKNVPFKLPWVQIAVLWLLGDRFQDQFVWGIVWTIISLLMLSYLYGLATTEEMELWK